MYAEDVSQAMASSAVSELQSVIADGASEIQQLLGDLRHAARSMDGLSESSEVDEQALDDLRWTVDSVQTELQEAQAVLRGALDRLHDAAASLK
jgi:uncharacterized protein YukE